MISLVNEIVLLTLGKYVTIMYPGGTLWLVSGKCILVPCQNTLTNLFKIFSLGKNIEETGNMDKLYVRLQHAQEDNDISRMISILEEIQHISRTVVQRETIKSIHNNSLKERKESSIQPYIFITVNPNATCSLQDFSNLINKMLLKKWLTSYIYVIEQRGQTEEDMGKGFHMHLVITKPEGKSAAHCIREIGSTFKKICDISNFHCYNTKSISEEEYQRKLKYMLGEKESTSDNRKDLKQSMDKIWRVRNNIEPFYFSNISIGEYAR